MITYTNISKTYSKFSLYLKELKLEHPVTGVLEHVGSGKTTLLKTLVAGSNGQFDSKSDHTLIFKPEVSKVPNEAIKKLIKMYSAFYKFDKVKAYKYLDQFNIDVSSNYKNHSEGQKDIITIILTMCCDVDLYILDEPFSRIDPINIKLITKILIKEISHLTN